MNRLTPAQLAQQYNRTADGKYAVKTHSEADIDLGPAAPGLGSPADYLTAERITADQFTALHEHNTANIAAFAEADQRYNQAHELYRQRNRGRSSYRDMPASDEMFDAHQQRKAAYYQMAVTDKAHQLHAQDHGFVRSTMPLTSLTHYQREIVNFERWKQRQSGGEEFVFRPNERIDSDYDYGKAKTFLATFTGVKPWDIDRQVDDLQQRQGLSRHDAMIQLYLGAKQRTDKPFVFIDLETASRPKEDIGTVDTGQYSDIIEVGYEKVYPDGRVETDSMLLDADENLRTVAGTGAVDVHGITEDMIDGKPKFSDPQVQQQMRDVLDGSVLVAHNANFEKTQFTFSLRGYGNTWRDTLDTKVLSKYFVKTREGNNHQEFVEAAGHTYGDDAHRALADVKMNRKAFDTIITGDRKQYLPSGDDYDIESS